MSKNKLYWLLQLGGWTGLMVISFMSMLLVFPPLFALFANLVFILFGILLSHLYRLYVKKKNWKELKIPTLVLRVLLASVAQGTILGLLSLAVLAGLAQLASQSNPSFFTELLGLPQVEGLDPSVQDKITEASMAQFTVSRILFSVVSLIVSFSIYFISWSALYFAYQYLQKNREMEIEKWKLSASVKDAELSALKSQINPHFIFNSLNNIRSLVIEDAERARDSITHLSDLLRFSIQFDQFEKVSLEKEIAVVADYLNLEAIQLEERLSYEFKLDQKAKEMLVPPMVIQTLVENAIKHSINELPHGGQIIVESNIDQRYLNLLVMNTGQMRLKSTANERRGIGINNSRERLRLLYGEKATLHVENMNEEMVCATVKIPLDKI